MIQARYCSLITICFLLVLVGGCTGDNTFSQAVRSGETVAVMIGWKQDATLDNTAVVIKDADGTVTRYEVGNSSIRAVTNLYPDPASKLIVGNETDQDLGVAATGIGGWIKSGGYKDWSATTVFFDLPDPMPLGIATIAVEINGDSSGYSYPTSSKGMKVDIVGNGGTPNNFTANSVDLFPNERLASMQRADHYIAKLYGEGDPYGLQATFSHDPDVDNDGVGRAFVVSTRGDRTNRYWSDNGTTLTVLITPTRNTQLDKKDFRMIIAGGITGVDVTSLKTFDEYGAELTGYSYKFAPKIANIAPSGPYNPGDLITITGEHLCDNCVYPDPNVHVGADGTDWQEANVTTMTPGALNVTLPGTIPNGVIWLETPHGVDSVALNNP